MGTIRILFIVISVTLIILLASALIGNNISVATRELRSTPVRVSPPLPGTTPTPEGSVEPSGEKQAAYFVTNPLLAGKALHWTKTDYSYQVAGLDPANGQPIKVDIWIQVDADGIPIMSHALSTFHGDVFLQEVLQTPDGVTVILGPEYPVNTIDGKSICRQHLPAYPTWMRRQILPPFVDEARLMRSGFRTSAALTPALPATTPLAGIQPLMTLSPDNTIQTWVLQELKGEVTNTKTLVVDASGRVLVSRGQITDSKGVVINESQSAHGDLEVYDPAVLPATTFAISQQALEACHD